MKRCLSHGTVCPQASSGASIRLSERTLYVRPDEAAVSLGEDDRLTFRGFLRSKTRFTGKKDKVLKKVISYYGAEVIHRPFSMILKYQMCARNIRNCQSTVKQIL